MQASKIKPQLEYAANYNGKLELLMVTSITTTRTGPNPSDFKHKITGKLPSGEVITIAPEAVLGPYTEHAELVAKKEAEKAEAQRQGKEKKDRAIRLVLLLYELIGEAPPEDVTYNYRAPIRLSFDGVDVRQEAVEKLLNALTKSNVVSIKSVG